jgi:hypothetical protein
MKIFKKQIIFFMTFEDSLSRGNTIEIKHYYFFKSKSKIINDFYFWVTNSMTEMNKNRTNNYARTQYVKIIGL